MKKGLFTAAVIAAMMMTQPINTIESDSEQHTITGFAPLSEDECHLYMSYYDKPSEADLIAELPSALNVYLDGSSEPQAISVSWKSIGAV